MPRVLVGVHGGGLTGIDTYAEQLAAAAGRVSGDVTLVATGPEVAAQLAARCDPALRILDLGLAPVTPALARRHRLSPGLAARRLEDALGAALARLGERFDIAHLNHPPLAEAARPHVSRVYVAGWFHPHALVGRVTSTWRHTGGRMPRSAVIALKGIAHHRNDVRGYRSSDCVLTPTRVLAEQLLRQGIAAVDCPPPCRAIATGAARSVGVHGTPRLVMCSGDLGHPRKNLAAALRALGLVATPDRPVEVELIGRNAESLATVIRRLPPAVRVHLAGAQPPQQVHARIAAANALLFPSLFEEWGYVAVESLLQGTPVITFPVYPFAEMLAPPLGRCAQDMSVDAYAAAVRAVLETPPDRAAIARVAEARFGVGAVGARLEAIWSAEPPRPRATARRAA